MNVLVYCGSRSGHDPAYVELAEQVGSTLSTLHCGLVYGGGAVGLMGIVANAVLAGGQPVIGVIPTFLAKAEIRMDSCTELIEVPSMHVRKQLMIERANAILALPGAYGTLDELFEALTWRQLGLHDLPIGILNVGGFYDPLLMQLDRMVDAGFLTRGNRDLLVVDDDVERLITTLIGFNAEGAAPTLESRA